MKTEENREKDKNSILKEFEKLLNQDFQDRKLKENEIIKATITEITKNFVVVDCKAKMEGMIPIDEFQTNKEIDKIKVGSKVDVYLERIESLRNGEIVISREKARRVTAWKKMQKFFESQEELTGYITGKVKGGFICTVDGLPTFMPASQISDKPLKKNDLDQLMNTPIKVVATRIDRSRGNVCTSRRSVLEKSKNAELKEVLAKMNEGDIIENAKVRGCTDYGIFLDINGVDALCHVSDLSHGRVKKPSEMVNVGDTMKVKIIKIDKKTNRISASVKALTDSPYLNLEKKYKVGNIYDGTVTKLVDYGAFIRLEDQVEGLVHTSALSWQNKNIHPSKVLSVSEKVKVKLISLDVDAKRISLSLRETQENPWEKLKEEIGKKIKVKIKNITDKAIFAELDNGLTGMLHYKELSWSENVQDLKNFKKNDFIDVKVLDVNDEKIRLSKRALDKDPMSWFEENKKKVGDVITTHVYEVLKTGVKVNIDPEKKLIVMIKKNDLAKEAADQRIDIFSKGNALDAKIIDFDIKSRKIKLSPRAAQEAEEASLVKKFGAGATKSGATLKGIFEKALGGKKKKKD